MIKSKIIYPSGCSRGARAARRRARAGDLRWSGHDGRGRGGDLDGNNCNTIKIFKYLKLLSEFKIVIKDGAETEG